MRERGNTSTSLHQRMSTSFSASSLPSISLVSFSTMGGDTVRKCDLRGRCGAGGGGDALSRVGNHGRRRACEWRVGHGSSPPWRRRKRMMRSRGGRIHEAPRPLSARPSPLSIHNLNISSNAAICHFRCWCLWRLSGCRTGRPPRPRAWCPAHRCTAAPVAGWTRAETLSAPGTTANSPAKIRPPVSHSLLTQELILSVCV